MDLIFNYSYKSRYRGRWAGNKGKIFLGVIILCSVVSSWRITQKCPHGHYYNDGCTACWCDTRTGLTKCERLLQCTRILNTDHAVKCPQGRIYKDRCGNDCSCYESTGAVFCNEKRKCPPEIPVTVQTTAAPIFPDLGGSNLMKRSGFTAISAPYPEETPLTLNFPVSSTPAPPVMSTVMPPMISTPHSRRSIFEKITISTTPQPHVRIPGRSDEVIIEPAIIIRKKGSNKASVVRNPSSATSLTLSSGYNPNGNNPTTVILNKNDNSGHSITYPAPKYSFEPLNLYEKQLQKIMDIRRAYTQLLRSKVNFNLQIASGKGAQNNLPFNRVVVLQEKNHQNPGFSPTDHPRRFDSNFDNSTILINTTPTPSNYIIDSRPHLVHTKLQPFFWRREQIKNAIKNFSPVPPLKQLVSYVSTSTESYLSQFLNNLANKNKQVQVISAPETSTPPPVPTPPPQPEIVTHPTLPSPIFPIHSYSTIEPDHDPFNPNYLPIHEIYQNHDFQLLTSTQSPPLNYYQHRHSYIANNYNDNFKSEQEHTTQFPFMHELMQEIARADDHMPTAMPKSSPALTAVPTFQTPGPPYAEIDVVQPLSFLPPPNPEPATPTRRTLMMSPSTRQPVRVMMPQYPTVRVNLDKPIYLPGTQPPPTLPPKQFHFPPPQPPSSQQSQKFYFPPPSPPPQPQRQPQPQQFRPQHAFIPQPQHNRRVHTQQSIITKHLFPYKTFIRPHYAHHPNQRNYHPPPQQRYPSQQYFIPRPKKYRLVLKGRIKEAATRHDDVVPNFVSKIAHEFFNKPQIYVPKIRPGKPLTLEKVVLNHKEIIPKEIMFSQNAGASPTKLRFTPQAHWKMREDLAKQGIMLNEPLPTGIQDYARNDPNVMEMDAPIKAIKTWETHTGMGMGTFTPQESYNHNPISSTGITQDFQGYQHPLLLPSPTPPQITAAPTTPDYQLQQELQHQLLLAQQQHNHQLHTLSNPSGSTTVEQTAFSLDPNDFNDFSQHSNSHNNLPSQLNIPGVNEVVVDKFIVHDPLNPSDDIQIFSTTTVAPPSLQETENVDLASILNSQQFLQRQGLPAAVTPTPPPAVLIRHHGAPSPSPPPQLPASGGNFYVTVINTTPKPESVNPLQPNQLNASPTIVMTDKDTGSTSIVSQIQDFLTDQMDFGARPQFNFYDMLFNSRKGLLNQSSALPHDGDDQIATATNVSGEEEKLETDGVADIFSMDYKNKHNRKPPEVIVIKVPTDHNNDPYPQVIEKKDGQEIEIVGGRLPSSNRNEANESRETKNASEEELSAEKSAASASKRRRNRKGGKRKRKRKKKNRRKGSRRRPEEEDERQERDESKEDRRESQYGPLVDGANQEAEQKFQSELDWKSQLMANICDLNPSSPLCLTYRSICLLMTSDD